MFTSDQVELLLRIARDTGEGQTFADRLGSITDTLSRLIPFTSMTVWVADPDRPEDGASQALFRNVDQRDLERYVEEYARDDPMVRSAMSAPRHPVAMSDLVPTRRFGRDAFTGEFLQRQGIRHLLAIMEPMAGGKHFGLCMHRERGLRDFTRREREALRIAAPDISRAAAGALLRERCARHAAARHDAGSESSLMGTVVLSAAGDVVHMDRAAERLCAEPGGRVVDVLVAMLERQARPATEGASRVEAVRLPDGRSLRIQATTLATRREADVLFVLERLEPGSAATIDDVARRIGLTPRELEIARLALQDLGYREIAFRLGVSIGTVNSHMARIHAKAGVSSRLALANVLTGRTPLGRHDR
ncbi:MAG: LuxR C-terminal-related transcriptional regulator [Planctomycetes bacterium]|nr:LuxR C-terminal-related transcriptional regulator [Planctomycetota bacterium]